jgi:iron complex outermembrane receptor protein
LRDPPERTDRRQPEPGPETSKQWNVGLVVEPVAWFNASVDVWEVKREGLVTRLTPQEVVANYTQFPEYIVRNADGTINYIQAGLVNAANENVRGVDVTARLDWQWLNGKWRVNFDGTISTATRRASSTPSRSSSSKGSGRAGPSIRPGST